MPMNKNREKFLIGRNELIDLPDLKLKNLSAKVDTGAYTSAIHCHKIKLVKVGSKEVLKFNVLDPTHPSYEKRTFSFTKFKTGRIKNSSGSSEKRYMVEIGIMIYGNIIKTEFSLTDRSTMKFPILLGRKFIQNGFIVDVNKTNLSDKFKKTEK
jgi:hypothetical protein